MDIRKALLNFIGKKEAPSTSNAPEGICPNCWGREEYGGQFYDRVKNENLNVNNSDSNVGWVAAYANKNLSGIVLKRKGNGQELICEKCQSSFQHSDGHTAS